MFKVNTKDTRTTSMTLNNFEHISHNVFLLLAWNTGWEYWMISIILHADPLFQRNQASFKEFLYWSAFFFDKFESLHTRSSRLEVFCKKGVVENFAKFTGKHLRQSLFFNKVAGLSPTTLLEKRLWHCYFPVNFAKLLRKPLVATFCDHWNFQPLLFVFSVCFGFSFSCRDFDLKQKRLGFLAPKVSENLKLFEM